jgi:hypothetical protein
MTSIEFIIELSFAKNDRKTTPQAGYKCDEEHMTHPTSHNPLATLFLNGEEGAIKHLFARDMDGDEM